MGIPMFYKHFVMKMKFPNVVVPRLPDIVHFLSIDMNGILHKCAMICYAYAEGATPERLAYVAQTSDEKLEIEYHHLVTTKLMEVVSQVSPTEALIIAIDGVAPLAKIKQQRQRRYKAASERDPGLVFDSNQITTGTDFMNRLDEYLTAWLKKNSQILPPTIIYSNHRVRGEGEHLIMDVFRNRPEFRSRDKVHAIYGLDADLMLLSLLTPIHNAYLVREDINNVVNINQMKQGLITFLRRSPTAISDFAVMMCFIGNDFLPPVISALDMSSSLHRMMRIYNQVALSLTERTPGSPYGYRLKWENFAKYLAALAAEEPDMLYALSYKPEIIPLRIVQDYTDQSKPLHHQVDMDTLRNEWYHQILSPPAHTDTAVFETLLKTDKPFGLTPENFNDLIESYVMGIAWVLQYYTEGPTKINQSYYYPYMHAPLFNELASMASQLDQNDFDILEDNYHFDIPHQLLSVMPPKSAKLIPSKLRHFVIDPLSGLRDLFPDTFTVEMDTGQRHGVALIPFVEPARVMDAINGVEFTEEEREYYFEEGKDLVIVRTTAPAPKPKAPSVAYPTKKFDTKFRPSSPTRDPVTVWKKVLPTKKK
jgi:5'-3' exonuclease